MPESGTSGNKVQGGPPRLRKAVFVVVVFVVVVVVVADSASE